MCEVLKSNFDEVYPEIEDAIKRSSFIAIDLEFTGLHFEDGCHNNLFDGGAERYLKIRKNCQNFTISQIGFAAFTHDTTSNCYTAHVFNVYVFPQSCLSLDERFSCQASSLRFLCQYEFDFNKFIYDGVPFLTHEQEAKLRALRDSDDMFNDMDKFFFFPIFTKISDWLREADIGDEIGIPTNRGVDVLMLQAKICSMFKEVWTRTPSSTNEVVVMKVSKEKRKTLEEESPAWSDRIINSLVGFSKVFRLISESKKPIVGHNMFMDLLLMYDKFHNKLPSSWMNFKTELHRILPNIYDTKHLASKCRKLLEGHNLASQTNIIDLFQILQSEKGRFAAFNSPSICLGTKSKKYESERNHEAGYDAYICGYVFLRLCHLLAADKMIVGIKPLRFVDYIHNVQPHKNSVNMMRANLMFAKIDGEDPKSHRPDWLYVVAKGGNNLPSAETLASMFEGYSSVDVQIVDSKTAVLAVSTFNGSKHILKAFRHDKVISVTRYNLLKHCKPFRYGLWCSIIAMGAICAWTFVGDK